MKLLLVPYLMGSIPFAYILSWIWRKVDIRAIGSENVGTTNVFKEIGILPGVLTGILDGLKGLLATLQLLQDISGQYGSDSMVEEAWPPL